MTDETLLSGRAAVVVGGSRGVGRAVADLLAACGAGVVVNGRDPDAVDGTVAAITGSGGRAVGVAGAANAEATATALMAACRDEYGSVDVLINCAGIAEPPGSSILSISGAQFQELLDAHLGTAFHTCRAAAPIMAEQRRGSIVNSGSVAFLGDYGGTGYPAGKGAINSLTLAMAAELAEHGVRANVVCPGAKTRLSTGADYEQHIRDLHARGLLDELHHAGVAGSGADRLRGTAVYLPGQRPGEHGDRLGVPGIRRLRRPIRPSRPRGAGLPRSPWLVTVVDRGVARHGDGQLSR